MVHLEIQLFVQYLGSYPEVEGDMKEMILVLLNKIVSAVSENVKIALKGMSQKQHLDVKKMTILKRKKLKVKMRLYK